HHDALDPQKDELLFGVFPNELTGPSPVGPGIRGMTHYECNSASNGDCYNYPAAVVPAVDQTIETAHEYFHMLGRSHPGMICAAKYHATNSVSWPPDEQGFLQGVKVDRRLGTGGIAGPYFVQVAQNDFTDLSVDFPKPSSSPGPPPAPAKDQTDA